MIKKYINIALIQDKYNIRSIQIIYQGAQMKELKLQLDPTHHIPMTYSAKFGLQETINLTRGQRFILQQQLKQRQSIVLRQRFKRGKQKQQHKNQQNPAQAMLQPRKVRSIIRLSRQQQQEQKQQKQAQKQFSLNVEKYRRILENIQEEKQQFQKEEKCHSFAKIRIINQKQQKLGQEKLRNYRNLYKEAKNKVQDFPKTIIMQKNPIVFYYNNLPNIAYKKKTNSKRCLSQAEQKLQSNYHSVLKNIQMSQVIRGKNKNKSYTQSSDKSKKFLDYKDKNMIEINLKLRQKYMQIAQTTRCTKKNKLFSNNLIKQKLQKQGKEKQISLQHKIMHKFSIKSQPSHKQLNQYGLLVSSKQSSYQYHCQFQDPDNPNSKNNDNRVYIGNFCRRSRQASKLLNNRIKLMLGRKSNRVVNNSILQKDNLHLQLKHEIQREQGQFVGNSNQIQDDQILSPSSLRKQKKTTE